MKIIPYNDTYRDAAHDIAIQTGSKDNLVNKQHHDFTLLMYCDPYLDHGKCFLLLDDEGNAQGYILSIEDGKEFKEIMKPYFKKIHEVAPDFECRCNLEEYEKYLDEYPAHLHIDIKENYTGNGNGTALMTTLLDALRKDGVKGIMVGVAKDNERAFRFYQKMGFSILESGPYGYTLGQKL